MKFIVQRVLVIATCLLLLSVSQFWFNSDTIAAAPKNNGKTATVDNIIVMICDGWGYNHIDATSYYQYGATGTQIYQDFPVSYALSTYMWGGEYNPSRAWSDFFYVTSGYTDSAASATAISTGVKTYNGAVGMDINNGPVQHILERAEDLGKATGVVTSVQFSHATPASFVAHNVSRYNYSEIAREMIYDSAVDVIMGCGNPWYNDDGQLVSIPDTYQYVGGEATWNDLMAGTAAGDANGDGLANDTWVLIQEREEIQSLKDGPTPDRVIGIPQVKNTLQYKRSGNIYSNPYEVPALYTVPSLVEMTEATLNILDNDPDGFFLMVEGGAVDWASHDNASGRVIEEMMDFNRAVEAVVEWIRQNSDWDRTFLIVTGDHECGYLLGPGSGPGPDPAWNLLINNGTGNVPGMAWYSGTHTNSLIPLFAKGSAASSLKRYANKRDPVRGSYMDNTEIGKAIFKCMNYNSGKTQ